MKKFYRFIVSFKLVHIVYWIYFGLNIYHGLILTRGEGYFFNKYDLANDLFFLMAVTYVSIYVLLPRFFYRKKYFYFFMLWMALCLVGAMLNTLTSIAYVSAFGSFRGFNVTIAITYLSHLIDIVRTSVIFLIVILIEYYIKKEVHNEKREKERLQHELNFLKAQMNPHFLFNALNNIYFLIDQDKELSKEMLVRFSSLMRYQLYECSSERVALESEISFLKHYIEIEKMRSPEISVDGMFEGDLSVFEIAPVLLVPFVENAFKHVSATGSGRKYIQVKTGLAKGRFSFVVENSSGVKASVSPGGLGIQNVVRRLELLYPGKHWLEIADHSNAFKINLEIELI